MPDLTRPRSRRRRNVYTRVPPGDLEDDFDCSGSTGIILVNGIEMRVIRYTATIFSTSPQGSLVETTKTHHLSFLSKPRIVNSTYKISIFIQCDNELYDVFANKQMDKILTYLDVKDLTFVT